MAVFVNIEASLSGNMSTPGESDCITESWESSWCQLCLLAVLHHDSPLFSMITSSNGNIFRVTGPLCGDSPVTGEFPSQRPMTRSFDVFFDLRLNKQLRKQSWGWWFETPSSSLWRHCNAVQYSERRDGVVLAIHQDKWEAVQIR